MIDPSTSSSRLRAAAARKRKKIVRNDLIYSHTSSTDTMEKQTKDTHAEEEGSEQTQAWALPFVPDSTTSLTNRARIPKAPEQERPIRVGGKRYVEKGSLTEAELLAAKQRVKSSIKRKKQVTEEDKKEERRISNRLSAFQSRNRRLGIIQDLQVGWTRISHASQNPLHSPLFSLLF